MQAAGAVQGSPRLWCTHPSAVRGAGQRGWRGAPGPGLCVYVGQSSHRYKTQSCRTSLKHLRVPLIFQCEPCVPPGCVNELQQLACGCVQVTDGAGWGHWPNTFQTLMKLGGGQPGISFLMKLGGGNPWNLISEFSFCSDNPWLPASVSR